MTRLKSESIESHSSVRDSVMIPPKRVKLPETERFVPSTASSFYGASAIAARYCGLADVPALLRGIWQHGWIPSSRQFHADALFGVNISKRNEEHLYVARSDEAAYLIASGFNKARAIGLPISYLPRPGVERKPGSLLVMPAHSLDYTSHTWKFDEYAEEIARIAPRFSEVAICVHPSCFEKGYWVDSFNRLGFTVYTGASVNDRRGLERIATLASSFEFVTTNTLGSHVAYASFCSAKVSIYGPYAEYRAEDFANTPFYNENPGIVDPTIEALSAKSVREQFPHLFCDPEKADLNVEWGERQVGFANRVSPKEMKELFGWDTSSRFVQQVKQSTPHRLKHWAKLAVKPEYRNRRSEIIRLRKLPKYTATTTNLLGESLEIVDAESFLYTHGEIFEREIYRFKTVKESPLIIDGGANIGLSVIYFKRMFPNGRIIAFEPDPKIFQVLENNCRKFSLTNLDLIPKGLWNAETVLQFRQEGSEAGRISQNGDPTKLIKIPTVRLRDYLDEEVDLLKLDIEGAETEVLLDCADKLGNVERMFVEYHSFADQPQTLNKLTGLLADNGFRIHVQPVGISQHPFIWRTVHQGMDMQLNIYGFRG